MKKENQQQTFPYIELSGALHLHTAFSDGGVTYPQMIQAAHDVGLDYVVITDHMALSGRAAGFEGFNGTVFVCVGYEHNDSDNKNHYLVMGTESVVEYCHDAQGYIDRVKQAGGIGFIAHPIEKRHYFKAYPPYPWTDWNAEGFDGIELWNQMSDWLENLRSTFHFIRLFYPRRFLMEIPQEILKRWDDLNRMRFVAGIGGVDAHTMKIRLGMIPLTVFPIKVELKGIRTHLYFSEPLPANDTERARLLLLDALRRGRGFITNFRRSDAKGTRIFLEYGDGRLVCPGIGDEEISPPCRLCVRLPRAAEIRCIRNGSCLDMRNGTAADFDVQTNGAYRIEAWIGKHAWIYSNPFRVGGYPLW